MAGMVSKISSPLQKSHLHKIGKSLVDPMCQMHSIVRLEAAQHRTRQRNTCRTSAGCPLFRAWEPFPASRHRWYRQAVTFHGPDDDGHPHSILLVTRRDGVREELVEKGVEGKDVTSGSGCRLDEKEHYMGFPEAV